jgi:hypothetical protein
MRHILFAAVLTWTFFNMPKQKIHPNRDKKMKNVVLYHVTYGHFSRTIAL